MKNVRQEVVWYYNYTDVYNIYRSMEERIDDGWRVHTCLNKSGDVLVVYEKHD